MSLDLAGLRAYVFDRLARELTPDLTYHSIEHTRDDVVPAALRLASALGLDPNSTALVETGALLHDFGFVECRVGHEQVGARVAREVLPGFGFSADQVDCVVGIVMATRLPQSPHALLEQIMADADLDVLGRDDFFSRNEALRAELLTAGTRFTDAEWYRTQLGFLEAHAYFTTAAAALRNEGKLRHIETIRARLDALTTRSL